jgi:hypothetical protein
LWHWPFILTQSRQEPEPQRKGSRERTENATIAASLGDGCRICRTDCGKFYSGGSRFDPDVEFAVPVAVNPTIVAQRGAGCRSFDPGDELIRAARRRCCAHCGWTAPVCRFGRPQPTWNGEQPFNRDWHPHPHSHKGSKQTNWSPVRSPVCECGCVCVPRLKKCVEMCYVSGQSLLAECLV